MVDVVDKETRSRMMARIRSANTQPEVLTRSALHRLGYRYKLNTRIGKIRPDIVLSRRKVAVFVHGCYWHQHEGCILAYTNRNYSPKWKKKFADNTKRDLRVLETLIKEGWRVAVIWECSTREKKVFEEVMKKLDSWIKADQMNYFETDFRKIN